MRSYIDPNRITRHIWQKIGRALLPVHASNGERFNLRKYFFLISKGLKQTITRSWAMERRLLRYFESSFASSPAAAEAGVIPARWFSTFEPFEFTLSVWLWLETSSWRDGGKESERKMSYCSTGDTTQTRVWRYLLWSTPTRTRRKHCTPHQRL